MIIDASELDPGHLERAEVCVVGAGPAGLTVAAALADAGARVCVVEAGSGSGGAWPPHGEVKGLPYDLTRSRAGGVGGSARLWDALPGDDGPRVRMRPLDPADVEGTDRSPSWPIDYQELAPYYRMAADLVGAGPGWFDQDLPAPTPPGLRPVEFRFTPASRFTRDIPERLAGADHVKLITGATVHTLTQGRGGRVVSAESSHQGRSLRFEADHFVLGGGGLGNAVILLASVDDGLDVQGASHLGRYFMEHPHLNLALITAEEDDLASTVDASPEGVPVEVRYLLDEEERHELGGSRLAVVFSERSMDEGLASLVARGPAPPWRRSLAVLLESGRRRQLPDQLLRHLVRAVPTPRVRSRGQGSPPPGTKVVMVSAMAEQGPRKENRVELAGRDRRGFRCRLHWTLSRQDVEGIVATQRGLLARLRPRHRVLYDPLDGLDPSLPGERKYGGGFHHMGTTRMAHGPEAGVVDPDGMVFGAPNLFVSGSSVFPSSGYANPTFTIVALALRLADRLQA